MQGEALRVKRRVGKEGQKKKQAMDSLEKEKHKLEMKAKQLQNSHLQLEKYEVKRTLGSCTFGEVFLVREKGTSKLLAMKQMKKKRNSTS